MLWTATNMAYPKVLYKNKVFIKKISTFIIYCFLFISARVDATGGIFIGGTRIIYSLDSRQESISIINSSTTEPFLVQSWVEDENQQKSHDFVVTPPLYLSRTENENTLRLLRIVDNLPKDKESLYYFIAKAIPSIEGREKNKSVLRIATASRIKLFVRPSGLEPAAEKAPDYLTFRRVNNQLEIDNPTPYYITITNISLNKVPLNDIMISPKSHATKAISVREGSIVNYRTINDNGAITMSRMKKII